MEKKYYVIGDLHGDFRPVRKFYQLMPYDLHKTENVLICLGDFGANFYFNYRDKKFKDKLGTYPFIYFVIRGNHEERASVCAAKNPADWHKEKFFGNTVLVENNYPYIKYALDCGGIYYIGNKKCLVVPGAYSVDKWYRLQNDWSWFPQEQLSADEMKNLFDIASGQNFDYVFSHTCPMNFYPFIADLFLHQVVPSQVDKSMEMWMNTLMDNIKWDKWYFGHYHDSRDIYSYKAIMLFDKVEELNF